MTQTLPPDQQTDWIDQRDENTIDLLDLLTVFAARWRMLVIAPIAAGALALAVTYLIPPTYTAKTVFLLPQQQQSSAASALSSLGALSGLAGVAVGARTSGDQYVALMQSVNIQDRIIEKFNLMEIYDVEKSFLARKKLGQNSTIGLGKKDGLISVEASAENPQLAADIANQYVAELRRLSGELALTEAQQRRVFFENQLKLTNSALVSSQQSLQASGFNPGALKAEPKAAAESYAKIKAEATAAEVRLQTLRRSLSDGAAEVQQQLATLSALRSQLDRIENSADTTNGTDYIGRYREFKYQETLFELFSRQFELARLDESREGALIQVVDVASPPEHKSKPKRLVIAAITTASVLLLLCLYLVAKHALRAASLQPDTAEKFAHLRAAMK